MPQVWFGHGLLERLGHIVPRYVNGQVCVVADQHTEAIAHGVAEALAGCVGAVFIHPGRLKAAQAAVRQVQGGGAGERRCGLGPDRGVSPMWPGWRLSDRPSLWWP